jgi:galactose mutarotase-like enzyme
MHLTNEHSSLTLNPQGGRIQELVLDTIPIFGTFKRLDGKEGNTHVCVPNFGDEGTSEFQLPAHGSGRNADWEVVDKTVDSIILSYDMSPTGTYPTKLHLEQRFTLTASKLDHTVSVENTGSNDAPVNIALHYYWYSPAGWDGLTLNNKLVDSLVRQDTHTIVEDKNTIHLPEHPAIQLDVTNCSALQLWTGRAEKDGEITYNQDFVCIEPVMGVDNFFGSEQSILSPKESVEMSAKISVSS